MMPNSPGHSSSVVGNLIWTSLPAELIWWSCLNGLSSFISDDSPTLSTQNKVDRTEMIRYITMYGNNTIYTTQIDAY